MERRVAVRAIIAKDGQLLCVKQKAYKGSAGIKVPNEYWCTIGGGVDPGEALISALQREVMEETGIKAKIGNLLYVQQFINSAKEHLEFFFLITNPEDFTDIDLSKTTHGEEEIAEIDFITPSKNNVLPEFLKDLDYTNLDNQPTQFFTYL